MQECKTYSHVISSNQSVLMSGDDCVIQEPQHGCNLRVLHGYRHGRSLTADGRVENASVDDVKLRIMSHGLVGGISDLVAGEAKVTATHG